MSAGAGSIRTPWSLRCADCGREHPPLDARWRCTCGGLLDVEHESLRPGGSRVPGEPVGPAWRDELDRRRATRPGGFGAPAPARLSGVWRYREWVLPLEARHVVSKPEGNTNLYDAPSLAAWCGLEGRLVLKHEGENPTGSFKDRGMTVAVSVARALGLTRLACASTGNTSASMAAYAAAAGMKAFVFIPEGQIAYGKLAQSLAYGARTIQIRDNFDVALSLVERVCAEHGVYLVNSVNPFRIEGQKAIAFELLQDLGWELPDWIVLPGGNLGNSSAVCKALIELHAAGVIARLPRVAVVQAAGANPLYVAWKNRAPLVPVADPHTLATAIRIGSPVSWRKCLRGLAATDGVVEQVDDQEILDAKAHVDAAGIGAEPASCAAVAGLRRLVASGVVPRGARVAAILTGHVLKDPDAMVGYHRGTLEGVNPSHPNPPVTCDATLDAVLDAMRD